MRSRTALDSHFTAGSRVFHDDDKEAVVFLATTFKDDDRGKLLLLQKEIESQIVSFSSAFFLKKRMFLTFLENLQGLFTMCLK